MLKFYRTLLILVLCGTVFGCTDDDIPPIEQISNMDGLIAFWDFETSDGMAFQSRYNADKVIKSFPLYLRQIGDAVRYSRETWPYTDESSALKIDRNGPFSHAVRFNLGYIYGEVPRTEFDGTPLDIGGKDPFTMIAWVRFDANRHMVAGIWDEGGWSRYAGRRQAALFAGLFNQKGTIAHISSTGAASFPQSNVDGSQYARLRAIDGQAFENGEWIAIAMVFDPDNDQVRAYLNGQMTKSNILDPVVEDVLQNPKIPSSNPLTFSTSIFRPAKFQMKFNGYDFHDQSIKEHHIWVDLKAKNFTYHQIGNDENRKFRITFEILRKGSSVLDVPVLTVVEDGSSINIPVQGDVTIGDVITARLEEGQADGSWQQVGSDIETTYNEGAPFTFGRALGLDEDGLDHGSSELYLDGVAVFDRVLSDAELSKISFIR